jgi:serine/threonine-protein kinase
MVSCRFGSQRRWLAPVAALVAVFLAIAIALAWRPWESGKSTEATISSAEPPAASLGSSAPAAPPSQPPVFPAKAIDSVLLTPDEVNSILGAYGMSGNQRVGQLKLDSSIYGMADHSSLVKPPGCVGVVFGAEHEMYADTGFAAMRDQTFTQDPYAFRATGSAPEKVEQTVVVFPSANQAQTLMTAAENLWRSCETSTVYESTSPEDGLGWKLGSVQRQGDLLTVPISAYDFRIGSQLCQLALGVRQNIIVGTRSCSDIRLPNARGFYDPVPDTWPNDPKWANNDAERLATAMLGKVKV